MDNDPKEQPGMIGFNDYATIVASRATSKSIARKDSTNLEFQESRTTLEDPVGVALEHPQIKQKTTELNRSGGY